MKNLFSVITLLIFVNTVTNYMIGIQAKEGLPVPVLDFDGDELRAGTSYFMKSMYRGGGGGVTANITEGICVYGVVQQELDTEMGEPLMFLPDGYKVGDVVHESTDLNIGFFLNVCCRPSNIWKVDDYDESAKQNFIMLDGSVGNSGNETVSNWFKIEKLAFSGYKIVFCPSVCDFCAVRCSDVGIYVKNGLRRLALSEDPFLVYFHKVRFEHKKYCWPPGACVHMASQIQYL